MKKITYSISREVFESVPNYVRGLVVVKNARNSLSSKELQKELVRVQETLKSRYSVDELIADQKITVWREAFLTNSMNPKEFRPAHEAMSRRIVGGKLIPSINTLVDIGNIHSISKLTPIGVHPLDMITSSLTLHKAVGDEVFVAFNATETESPKKGEIILSEGKDVFTRAWIWRQSASSITLTDSKHVVINIDMLEGDIEANRERATEIALQMTEDIKKYCNGETELYILDRENSWTEFEVE